MNFDEAWSDTCSSVGQVTRTGNATLLKKYIKEEKPVDVPDNRGWRPLHEAAAVSPTIECLEILLKHGKTDINWTTHSGETALLLACKRRQGSDASDFVKLLLQFGADPNIRDDDEDSPLLEALYKNNLDVVERLIAAGVNVNASDCGLWTPLHEAAKKPDASFVRLLLTKKDVVIDAQDECGLTPVFVAAQHGREQILMELLSTARERGHNHLVNLGAKDFATPLIIAAQQGFSNCVKILLEYGADPNLKTSDHATALHLAVQGGNQECLSLILNTMDLQPVIKHFHPEYYTSIEMICPLHLAIDWKQYESLEALLAAGFSPDSLLKTEYFVTVYRFIGYKPKYESALSYSISNFDEAAVKILLNAGANCSPPVKDAFHPVISAMRLPSWRILRLLLERGSDVNFDSGRPVREVLCWALATRSLPFLRLLLFHGLDPNADFGGGDGRMSRAFVSSCLCFAREGYEGLREQLLLQLRFSVATRGLRDALARLHECVEIDLSDMVDEMRSPSSLKQICMVKIRQYLYSLHKVRLPYVISHLGLPKHLEQYIGAYDLNVL